MVAYRESLALAPSVEARSNLGAALAALGRYQEAIESYRGALAMAPRDGVHPLQPGARLLQVRRPRAGRGGARHPPRSTAPGPARHPPARRLPPPARRVRPGGEAAPAGRGRRPGEPGGALHARDGPPQRRPGGGGAAARGSPPARGGLGRGPLPPRVDGLLGGRRREGRAGARPRPGAEPEASVAAVPLRAGAPLHRRRGRRDTGVSARRWPRARTTSTPATPSRASSRTAGSSTRPGPTPSVRCCCTPGRRWRELSWPAWTTLPACPGPRTTRRSSARRRRT